MEEDYQLARLALLPRLRNHYIPFKKEIINSFSFPARKAVCAILFQETDGFRETVFTGEDIGIFCLSKFTFDRGKIGIWPKPSEKFSRKDLIEILPGISSSIESLSKQLSSRESQEEAFRNWLEKGIFRCAAEEEPNFLESEGPIEKAIKRLSDLRNFPFCFRKSESTIAFPLETFVISSKPKIPIGIDSFDRNELEGGVEEDSVMILAGESNIGKSHLGLHCLSSLSLNRLPVLVCSGEDSIEMTRRRVFAHYLHVPVPELLAMTEAQRMTAFTQLYGDRDDPESLHHHIRTKVGITCIEEGKLTPKTIVEKLDEFEQSCGRRTAAFMLDYLQKTNLDSNQIRSRMQRDEELEQVVNQIKQICQDRKTFGLIISQVPSHAASGNFEFLNLRQAVARSYAATWGAHYVITMSRTAEEIRRLSSSADKRPRLNLFLCKSKDGALGVCYVLGNPASGLWEFFRSKEERDIAAAASNPYSDNFTSQTIRLERSPSFRSARAFENL